MNTPVYLMTRDQCIEAINNGDTRTREIAGQFYKITGELISKYC